MLWSVNLVMVAVRNWPSGCLTSTCEPACVCVVCGVWSVECGVCVPMCLCACVCVCVCVCVWSVCVCVCVRERRSQLTLISIKPTYSINGTTVISTHYVHWYMYAYGTYAKYNYTPQHSWQPAMNQRSGVRAKCYV